MRPLFSALFFCFLFSSCDSDNSDNDGNLLTQKLYSTLEISNSQVATYFTSFGFDQTSIQITDGSIFFSSDTTEYYVYEGATFYYPISVTWAGGSNEIGCSDVTIKTYQNDSLVDEQFFQFGFSSFQPNGVVIYCDPLAANNLFQDILSLVSE